MSPLAFSLGGLWLRSIPVLRSMELAVFGVLVLGCVVALNLVRRTWPQHRALLRIVPPADCSFSGEAWAGFFRSLLALTPPAWKRLLLPLPWVTVEYHWSDGRLVAGCACPAEAVQLITAAAAAALPGADVAPNEGQTFSSELPGARARLKLWREPLHPLGTPRVDSIAAVITAMTGATEAALQVAIAPDSGWERRAQRRLDQVSGFRARNGLLDIVFGAVGELISILVPFAAPPPEDSTSSTTRAPSVRGSVPPPDKAWTPALKAEIRLGAWAPTSPLAKHAMHAMVAGLRGLDGANGLRPRRVLNRRAFDRALVGRSAPGRASMSLSPGELASIFHMPVSAAPMESAGVRLAPRRLPKLAGSELCRADGGPAGLIRIAQPDRRQHVAISGPTGAGKSALLMSLALQDVRADVGLGVVDPKGDLVRDLCERIPESDADRVVLIDPSHRDLPIGLNVLECPDAIQREVVCDSLVTIFRKTFQQFWGPRTEDVLRASLLTVMRHPGLTICEVPLLLLNDEFRVALTEELDDTIGLRPFWDEYEQLSPGQRLQMVGPALNKLRAFLLRPTVRNILGQSHSTIDLADVINERGILLVSLAKGLLGEDISRLLGAFIVARLWQTALGRIALPPDQRPDFNLYLDEFQTYLYLPQSLDDVLAEARAYRLNLTMANQHYGQLRDSTREAIDANARTRIAFQCGQEDARYLAREFAPLTDQQLQNLGRYQVAVRLCVDGHTEPAFTGVTLEPPGGLGQLQLERLVQRSLSRYGRPRAVVEGEMQTRLRRFGIRGDFQELAS